MPGSEANITASDAGDAVDELLRFERLLADVSSRFIDLPHDRIDEAIDDGLRQIVTALGTDRSTLLDVDPKSGRVVSTHSWAAPGFHTYAKGDLPPTYPWALTRLRAGLPVVFSRPDELPAEAAVDRASYESIGQVSHVAVPVMVSRQLIAVLTFGTLRKERTWSGDLVGRLQLLGTVFAGALARKRAQDRVDELLRFERLMTGQSVRLAESSGRNLDVDVNAALRDVAALLAADRCVLWDLFLAPVRATVTHHWTAEIAASLPHQLGAADIPWILDELVAGNVVSVSTIAALPPDAQIDAAALRAAGVRSLLTIPLRINASVVAALSLSCLRDERGWSDEMVPRLRLFGEMLVNAIAFRSAEQDAHRAAAESVQLRETLAHLARVDAVSAMSAAVAHEVNQPLMAIRNYALAGRQRLVGGAAPDRAKIDLLLEKIASQAALASEVLDRLHAMVKRHNPQEVEIDLAKLISEALKIIQMEGRMKDIRIETDIAPDLPRALGDGIQVQQVLLNLTHNAMGAMATAPMEARVLRVEANVAGGGQVLIRVVDRGSGIALSDEERVYEPFYTTKETGLGIGLSICRTLVEAHGGRLWHVPNAGGGTVFQFTLPQAGDGG